MSFWSIARPSHTILRWWAKIKKSSLVLRTRKILPMMMDEKPQRRWCVANGIDERGEWIEALPTTPPHYSTDGGHDGVDLIFSRQVLRKIKIQKVGTQKGRKTTNYHGKVCNRPPKWVDDDRTDWTMRTTTEDHRCTTAYSEAMRWQWCVYCCRICSPSWEKNSKSRGPLAHD